MSNLTEEVVQLRKDLADAQEQKAEADKEQEDVSNSRGPLSFR